jgi:TetR/AcrR family transcriptional regulator, regulator of autoinduction and epiphytic fitness
MASDPSSPRSKGSAVSTRSEKAIVAAARSLFLERGYEAVSVDDIARVAGVARQTVFNRFMTKDAVFRAMIADHWTNWGKGAAMEQVPYDAPVERHLRAIARSIAAFQDDTQQIQFQRLVVAESRHHPWIGPAAYRSGKQPRMKALAAHFGQLHKEGRLRCEKPDIAAWQFVALVQEFIVWPKVMAADEPGDIPSTKTVIDEAIATFMARYGPRK